MKKGAKLRDIEFYFFELYNYYYIISGGHV